MSLHADPSVAGYEEARAWAAYWSQRWFLDPEGRDAFSIHGIDAGWATHVEAFLLLQRFALEAIGEHGHRQSPSLIRTLKSRGLDRAVRSLGMRASSRPALERRPIAVIVEIPTPSGLEPGAAVAQTAGTDSCAIAASDPRAVWQLRRRGLRPHALHLPWLDELREVRAARRVVAAAWHDRRAAPPRMALRGRDVSMKALTALRPLALRSMPWIAAEHEAVERWVDVVQPAAIAIASDQHRIGRLVEAVARRHDVATVVLQHGLPQAPVGYLPVVADRVATWSDSSSAWFEAHGTESDRLQVTGNPRLDLLARGRIGSAKAVSILLPLSPTTPSTNRALVLDAIAALNRLPEAELVVKLHPGQSDWASIQRLIEERGGNRVLVRRHEALYPLLAAASVTILHRSSVAVESLAAGRPVVVYRAGSEPTVADEELRALQLPVVDTAEGIAEAVTGLSRIEERERYFAERRTSIDAATGPLDGESAARIVALLRELGHASQPNRMSADFRVS